MDQSIGTIPQPPVPGAGGTLEVSWELFGELCRVLALRAGEDYEFDVIVGIATAGVIPAAVIADMQGVEFYSMKITRRSVGDQPELISNVPVQAGGRRVLLVDEISTSGETLRLALASLRDVLPAEIRTATCFSRPGGYSPDYHALETDADVIFPWDL